MSPVASGIPAVDTMLRCQLGQKWKPILVAGRPAVEEDQRGAIAGYLDMDFLAVIGHKMRHGAEFRLLEPASIMPRPC